MWSLFSVLCIPRGVACACVRACVCVCARARVCVCVCVYDRAKDGRPGHSYKFVTGVIINLLSIVICPGLMWCSWLPKQLGIFVSTATVHTIPCCVHTVRWCQRPKLTYTFHFSFVYLFDIVHFCTLNHITTCIVQKSVFFVSHLSGFATENVFLEDTNWLSY
jgi:hypothetical protein